MMTEARNQCSTLRGVGLVETLLRSVSIREGSFSQESRVAEEVTGVQMELTEERNRIEGQQLVAVGQTQYFAAALPNRLSKPNHLHRGREEANHSSTPLCILHQNCKRLLDQKVRKLLQLDKSPK
ncbi:hypothetical protein FGO68_gene1771 [Halteria grandinella]|uniref:Uncharacterized protein n=1 Tax=Halteria grandinella TaxID=5974 RepID=A0A8J8NWT0_HALGN|nr:hypothetical protein FGO68_gene1771 [Halteria grandinella]